MKGSPWLSDIGVLLGAHATSRALFLVGVEVAPSKFGAPRRLLFDSDQEGWQLVLFDEIKTTLLDFAGEEVSRVALLSVSSGQYGASVETIKAEGILELVCLQRGIAVTHVTPQRAARFFNQHAAKGDWRKVARSKVDPASQLEYWTAGVGPAAAAAYLVSSSS